MSSLPEKIEQYRQVLNDLAAKTKNIKELEEVKQAFLGRKNGHLTLLFEELKQLPPEEKKAAGIALNNFKMEVQKTLAELEEQCLRPRAEKTVSDLTLPGKRIYWGAPHPLTLFQRKIEKIFVSMGFSVEDGPEIETDYYNFEALNFPPYHPARDSWDTLYINDKLLLRTHTSPVQIRVMEKRNHRFGSSFQEKFTGGKLPTPLIYPCFIKLRAWSLTGV